MTQASCEADVLSCYYLQALNNTEAIRLVIFIILVTFIIRPLPSIFAQHFSLRMDFEKNMQSPTSLITRPGELQRCWNDDRSLQNGQATWFHHCSYKLFTQVFAQHIFIGDIISPHKSVITHIAKSWNDPIYTIVILILCSFLKRLLKPEMYNEWIYYYGIEENDQVCKIQEYTMSIQWVYNEYTMSIQWTCNEYTMSIQWVYNDYTMSIQWVYNEYTMSIQWAYNEYTMSVQWVFNEWIYFHGIERMHKSEGILRSSSGNSHPQCTTEWLNIF